MEVELKPVADWQSALDHELRVRTLAAVIVARYYKDAEALRRDIASEMNQNGITIKRLAEKSGEPECNVRFLIHHGFASVGTTMRVLTALDVKPANLPRECITCHMKE